MTPPRIRIESAGQLFMGRAWESRTPVRVGRADNLEIVLDHPTISRHHAEIRFDQRGWMLRDLGSTNGTFLNGVRVGQAERRLAPRDILRCGNLYFTVAWLTCGEGIDAPSSLAGPRNPLLNERRSPGETEQRSDLFLQTVTAMAQAVELRDKYTGGHTQRVTNYALMLADELALTLEQRRLLQIGTPLHDIGKIGVDDAILRKSGRLTEEEYEAMKAHTLLGTTILETIPDLKPILPIVRSHHERWDGSGYPDGLAGEQIPLLARIVAVADTFDAMVSDRPYRAGLSTDKAFAELEAKSGIDFDPCCVQAFLNRRSFLEEMVRQERRFVSTQKHPVGAVRGAV
jgi:HD-GYP domain-containing protein (c-di-GMP phosphodiesterase class II)